MAQQKLYTEEQVIQMIEKSRDTGLTAEFLTLTTPPIELPSDEEIESKYNKFIDTEIELKFLKQEQGERLKWYYKKFFIKYK